MKRNVIRLIVCVLMILATVIAPVSTAYAASTVKLMKVNVDDARLRAGPSSAYEVITTINLGEKVFYAGKSQNAFCYVCTEDGQKGYVFRDYLSNYGVVRVDQVYYATGNARMYSRANTGSSRVETLTKNEMIIVFKTAGKWAYARTLDGKAGYVQLSYLNHA